MDREPTQFENVHHPLMVVSLRMSLQPEWQYLENAPVVEFENCDLRWVTLIKPQNPMPPHGPDALGPK
jgi:hypothetical protein